VLDSTGLKNADFLLLLKDAQERQRAQGPGSFAEWRQEALLKAPRSGGIQTPVAQYGPGFGNFGHLGNTNSRAPAGPRNRPSGNPGVGFNNASQQFGVPSGVNYNQGPSQYSLARPNQPPPWIDDVDMGNTWYSPFEPVWPFGPPNYTTPRDWNFPTGYNLNYIQSRMELMGTLRGMRASWGILSTVIATRQDQLLSLPWTVQVRGKPRASSKAVDAVKKFFRRPDGQANYGQWARRYLDDLFVLDAPTLFMDRNLGGELIKARILDGATIFPLIDDAGRRPETEYNIGPDGLVYERRQPAYQQIIHGLPMLNMSEDEIIYGMMRPRPEMPVFGYSPVEQILTEATEAIRKTFYQLEFWRSGSMPEMIITVPDNWTPRQIAMFQGHFDALLSGQLTLKSKVRFVPGGMKPFDIKNASGESLWSQRDELLVRLCCYAFSVSPTPFIHQSNRATANASQEAAEQEGLFPLMSEWKDNVMDNIIQEKMGFEDIEFTFLPRTEPDRKKQAEIHDMQLRNGSRTINQVLVEDGYEPVEDGDEHLIYTGNMVLPLGQVIDGTAMVPGMPAPENKAPEPKGANQTSAANAPVSGEAKPRTSSPLPETKAKPTKMGKVIDYADIKDAANETERKPSKIKSKIGNYKKGHISLRGFSITIENAKGSKREEKDRFGVKRGVKMPAAYGYIRGTVGADNMQVDVYLGKHPESEKIWVIDQDKFTEDGKDRGFDEHKVMLGYLSAKKALKDYQKSHYDGLGYERMSAVTEITYPDLKKWLKKGDMKKPISEQGVGNVIARRGKGLGLEKFDTVSQATGLLSYDFISAGKRRKKKKKTQVSGPTWLTLSV